MGLDVTLGLMVLLAGTRGWFRGFVLQAIRLGALVACIYAADPIRDVTRPYARQHIPTMRPELLDKLLWWTAAVVAYVVLSGVATWIVQAYRRRPHVDLDRNMADEGAGFLLGAAKGFVAASFLASGIERYSANYLKEVAWAHEQVETSHAMAWAREVHPAERFWQAQPVRRLVAQVSRGGLDMPEPEPEARTEARALPTSESPQPMELPQGRALDPTAPSFLRDLDEGLKGEDARKSR